MTLKLINYKKPQEIYQKNFKLFSILPPLVPRSILILLFILLITHSTQHICQRFPIDNKSHSKAFLSHFDWIQSSIKKGWKVMRLLSALMSDKPIDTWSSFVSYVWGTFQKSSMVKKFNEFLNEKICAIFPSDFVEWSEVESQVWN